MTRHGVVFLWRKRKAVRNVHSLARSANVLLCSTFLRTVRCVKIEVVLLAPNDPSRPSPASTSRPPAPSARDEANFNYALIGLAVALLTYSLITGFGLAGGSVPAERAYILMTPVPLVLLAWHLFGALRSRPLDLGLVLLAGGWTMLLVTLLLKHLSVQSALARGVGLAGATDSPLTWICALLSLALLVAGAALCAMSWRSNAA